MTARSTFRFSTALLLALASYLVGACSRRPVRFADAPPAMGGVDQAPISVPSTHRILESVYLTHVYLRRPLVWALTAERPHYAKDVNSFDQVPDSSWYVQRPQGDNVRASYVVSGAPEPPLSAIELTADQSLVVRDANGKEHLLILDPRTRPETVTAAGAISSRIMWSLGYRTEESHVVQLRLEHFGGAQVELADAFLKQRTPWGSVRDVNSNQRVLAISREQGIDLGATLSSGTREGDANDVVDVVDRRTLRTLGIFAWWLDIRGIGRFYTKDFYAGPYGRGHVVHYIVGLQNSLKASTFNSIALRHDPNQVHGDFLENLYTFGLADRPPAPRIVKQPLYQYASEELPPRFSPIRPYDPLDHALVSDVYWAVKRVLAQEDATLRWAVNNAQLTDNKLANDLAAALQQRGRQLAKRVFAEATPLEILTTNRRGFELVDLSVRYQITEQVPRYDVAFFDASGDQVGDSVELRVKQDVLRVLFPPEAPDYLVAEIRPKDRDAQAAEFHFKVDANPRLLGVRH